jgi:hypothetical protein
MLNDREKELLQIAGAHYKYPGAREAHVRERFGIGPTAFYVEVNQIINRPDALEHDPLTVKRLLRLRDRRRAARSA